MSYLSLESLLHFQNLQFAFLKTRDLPLDIRNYRVHFYEMDHLESLRLKLSERLDHLDEFRSNPIVNSARPHFDFREAIAKNLDATVEERRRATELREFTELRWADNEAVADSLIQQMWNAIGLESRKSIIAISGAGSIGKSTFAKLLVDRMEIKLPNRSFEILPTDSYMLDRASRIAQNITGFNIESHDMMACGRDLSELIAGNSVKIRPYDHTTGKHAEERTIIAPDILILEGIHSFHPPIDKQLDFRIFIYSSKPVVKALKYMADYFERGYSPIDSFQHSEVEYVDYENYVLPYYRNANSVIDVTGYWRYRLGDLRGEFTEGSYAEKQNSSN